MDQNLDIMPENQISADYMYIETILVTGISLNFTDTLL